MIKVIEVRPFMHEGKPYVLAVVPDEDTHPSEYECYSDADIDAYDAGGWRYVGLIVTDEEGKDTSRWSVHYGTGDGWTQDLAYLLAEDYYASSLASELFQGRE